MKNTGVQRTLSPYTHTPALLYHCTVVRQLFQQNHGSLLKGMEMLNKTAHVRIMVACILGMR